MTWNRGSYTSNNDGVAQHADTSNMRYRCCNKVKQTVCPNGFTNVDGLCFKDDGQETDYYKAQDNCVALGAHICTHNEMQQMCGSSNPFNGDSAGWFGDHGTTTGGNWDDEFIVWNRNFCDKNNDGPAVASSGSYAYRCCKTAALA